MPTCDHPVAKAEGAITFGVWCPECTQLKPPRTRLVCGCPQVVGAGAAEGEFCDDCQWIVRRVQVVPDDTTRESRP